MTAGYSIVEPVARNRRLRRTSSGPPNYFPDFPVWGNNSNSDSFVKIHIVKSVWELFWTNLKNTVLYILQPFIPPSFVPLSLTRRCLLLVGKIRFIRIRLSSVFDSSQVLFCSHNCNKSVLLHSRSWVMKNLAVRIRMLN